MAARLHALTLAGSDFSGLAALGALSGGPTLGRGPQSPRIPALHILGRTLADDGSAAGDTWQAAQSAYLALRQCAFWPEDSQGQPIPEVPAMWGVLAIMATLHELRQEVADGRRAWPEGNAPSLAECEHAAVNLIQQLAGVVRATPDAASVSGVVSLEPAIARRSALAAQAHLARLLAEAGVLFLVAQEPA